MAAAKGGHVDVVKLLLQNSFMIEQTNDYVRYETMELTGKGKTALMLAAEKNRYQVVSLLLQRGAKPHATDSHVG